MLERGDGPTCPPWRLPLLGAALLAGLTAPAEAARSPFRAALAAQGGCGGHRTLVEQRLGPLDAPAGWSTTPVDPREDLFGKSASAWGEADIRDALAVYAACEDRDGGAPVVGTATPRPETARLERMLRRLVALSQAKDAPEDESGRSPNAVAPRPAEQAGTQPRERRVTAFVPRRSATVPPSSMEKQAAATGSVPPGEGEEGEAAASLTGATSQFASADAATSIDSGRAGRGAGQRSDTVPLPGARALSGVVPLQATPTPPVCPLTMAGFRQVRADMPVQEVEAAIGCPGSLDTATTIPGVGEIEIYTWADDRTNARITMTFYDKRLKRKSQRGLD